ncbi:MAG: anti-sigma factor antagonist [Caldilinea sp. CFX5]|nr:anti-sigma factor antagonist [Caldilinea sp. CFX5]
MPKATLQTNVRMHNPIGIIDIRGEVNDAAETALMNAFHTASDNGAKIILLNFSGLDYMNSAGIGLLVTLLIRVQRNQQQLWACGLSAHYRDIFVLTRLNEAIRLFDTEAEAIAAQG